MIWTIKGAGWNLCKNFKNGYFFYKVAILYGENIYRMGKIDFRIQIRMMHSIPLSDSYLSMEKRQDANKQIKGHLWKYRKY